MSGCDRRSGHPMIISIQLSITQARILVKMLFDCVTSLKRIKSKTSVPYMELLCCVPASPPYEVGMSCLLECMLAAPAIVLSYHHAAAVAFDKRCACTRVKRVSAVN